MVWAVMAKPVLECAVVFKRDLVTQIDLTIRLNEGLAIKKLSEYRNIFITTCAVAVAVHIQGVMQNFGFLGGGAPKMGEVHRNLFRSFPCLSEERRFGRVFGGWQPQRGQKNFEN